MRARSAARRRSPRPPALSVPWQVLNLVLSGGRYRCRPRGGVSRSMATLTNGGQSTNVAPEPGNTTNGRGAVAEAEVGDPRTRRRPVSKEQDPRRHRSSQWPQRSLRIRRASDSRAQAGCQAPLATNFSSPNEDVGGDRHERRRPRDHQGQATNTSPPAERNQHQPSSASSPRTRRPERNKREKTPARNSR